jgi:copper chaperone CopZ
MTHTYNVSGMTCSGCEAKVKALLSRTAQVQQVTIDLANGTATIDMEGHVPTARLQEALKDYPKYQLTEQHYQNHQATAVIREETQKSWLATYKPILLIFSFITGITLIVEMKTGSFNTGHWMADFMAGFFLVFSFFKLLDLKAFAESYASYDIIARKWTAWGYVYAFTELALGLAYLTGFQPLLTNAVTFIVMSLSITGVLQSVLHKRKIQCACLGAVFNLPMSTVTIIEDALMIVMSGIMFFSML